jgi:hypothetical protein
MRVCVCARTRAIDVVVMNTMRLTTGSTDVVMTGSTDVVRVRVRVSPPPFFLLSLSPFLLPALCLAPSRTAHTVTMHVRMGRKMRKRCPLQSLLGIRILN